jgi:phospholipid/cholesterol/gamma-HCH transport system substrate-binding protein
MAGVQVGKVSGIALTNEQVRVALKMDKSARARTDSLASIKSPSLLGGQNYVAIDFGKKGALADDGTLLASVEQPDMDEIMVKLDHVATGVENLTKTFSGDKLSNLLGPLTDVISQNGPHISAIITNAENITAQVASGKGTVGKLIYDEGLYGSARETVTNFQATADEIKKAVADARAIIAQVNAGQGTVGRLVKDDKLYNEAAASMTNLKEILQKINGGKGTVGQLVNDDTMLKNVKVSLQKLDKATEGLEDTGPLTVLGAAVGKLF